MKNNKQKIAILLLCEFLKGEVEKKELLEKYSIKDSTFYKYVQFMKEAGFIIKNKNGIYRVISFPNYIKFENSDKKFFVDILKNADSYLSLSKAKIFKNEFLKILEYSNSEVYFSFIKEYEENTSLKLDKKIHKYIQDLKKYIQENKTLKIRTSNQETILIKPVEIIYKKDKVFLNFLNKEKETYQNLPIDCLKKVSTVNDNDIYTENVKETIFEISGKLALSYILKENERIIDKLKDKIIVANSDNNKNYLFKRLLRYDIYCKILFPKKDVEDFKNFIKNSIENIK